MYKCEKCGTTSMTPAQCPTCGAAMIEAKEEIGQAGDVKPATPPETPPTPPPAVPMPPAQG